ncbi:MAG: gluconate 2-dehydrogenase subunit 3 family protein [Verrucomicrobiota bacterium]
MKKDPNMENALEMNRRQAIKRAGLMLGAALSASTLSGVAAAQTRAAGAKGKAVNLSAKEFELVSAFSERILPRTDTPGAVDVGVPEFADAMFGGFLSESEEETFRKGLASVDAISQETYRKAFVDLGASEQDAVIQEIAKSNGQDLKSFYRKARELTIVGYFTSEEVMRNVLNYDFIPGRYDGCVPISETGNVLWAH